MSIFVDFGNFLLNPYLRKIFTLSFLPVVPSLILHYSDFDRVEKLFLKNGSRWKMEARQKVSLPYSRVCNPNFSENFDDYMKKVGVGWVLRKAGATVSSTTEITQV